jgi:uncharacterized protein involved in outer membrane biogenesis
MSAARFRPACTGAGQRPDAELPEPGKDVMPPNKRRRRRINRRFLIWIGSGVAAALLLPLVVVGILIATLDPNAYKARIEASMRQALGRDFHILGDLSVTASLSPKLVADNVTLANMPGGTRPDMVRIDRMEVQLQPRALLTGRLLIARLVLLRPDILLETNAAGEGNWRFDQPATPPPATSPPATQSAAAPAAPAAAPPAAPKVEAPRLLLQTLNIRDGHLTWRDGRTGRTTVMDIKRIAGTARDAESAVAISGEIDIGRQHVIFTGQTGPLARLQDSAARSPWGLFATVENAGAKLTVVGSLTQPMEGRGYSLRLDGVVSDLGNLSWLAPSPLPPLRNLTFSAKALDTGGPYPDISSVTVQAGQTNLDRLSPGFTLDNARLDMPRLTEPVQLTAEGTYAAAPLRITGTIGAPALLLPGAKPGTPFPVDVNVAAGGANFALRGNITTPTRMQGIDIAVGARVPDLSLLSTLAGMQLPPLHDIAFSARFADAADGFSDGVNPAFALKDIVLTLPQADMTGEMMLQASSRPRVKGTLKFGRIDVDALLAELNAPVRNELYRYRPANPPAAPAVDATVPPPLPSRGNTLIPDTELPVQLLGAGDAELQVAAGELRAGGVSYRDASAALVLKDGNLTVDPMAAVTPGGRVEGKLSVRQDLAAPPVTLAVHGAGLDLKPLLSAYGVGDVATGRLDVDADVHAAGRSPHALAATLGGRMGAALVDGELDNAVLSGRLGGVLSAAKLTLENEVGRTKLRCLVIQANAASGVATLAHAVLDSNRLMMTATGSVNLAAETLAVQLRPTVRAGGPSIVVPVRLSGSFRDPAVALDPSGLSQAATQTAAQAALGAAARLLGGNRNAAAAVVGALVPERSGDACGPAIAAVHAR